MSAVTPAGALYEPTARVVYEHVVRRSTRAQPSDYLRGTYRIFESNARGVAL
jgi:hypothetical protein